MLDLDDAAPLEDAEELAARQRLTTRKPARPRPPQASTPGTQAAAAPAFTDAQGPASSSAGDGWGDGEAEDTWAAFESSVTGSAPSPAKREPLTIPFRILHVSAMKIHLVHDVTAAVTVNSNWTDSMDPYF